MRGDPGTAAGVYATEGAGTEEGRESGVSSSVGLSVAWGQKIGGSASFGPIPRAIQTDGIGEEVDPHPFGYGARIGRKGKRLSRSVADMGW